MVKLIEEHPFANDKSLNIKAWLQQISRHYQPDEVALITKAVEISQEFGQNIPTFTRDTALQHGLNIAYILATMSLDKNSIMAGIILPSYQYGSLGDEKVETVLGADVLKLIQSLQRIEDVQALSSGADKAWAERRLDNLRRMLLAVVEDVRVIVIKLAERMVAMRAARKLDENIKKAMAKEVSEIYGPLANRLGMGHIKWELEDFTFRFMEPQTYKQIAQLLDERRIDREKYIADLVDDLKQELAKLQIKGEVYGRVKHIYSIWRKMRRKNLNYHQIYDVRAVRILVPTLQDCYAVLGIVHSLWKHIPNEFDDYIATPKENGYRSLHTAVIGPGAKTLEIQIRTFDMHEESELGVAAHWRYKEGGPRDQDYETKIAYLRQILEDVLQVSDDDDVIKDDSQDLFSDRVYIITPKGDVVDLPNGSTPIDFAYHVHTEIGHCCRGAKVNGNIVPLSYSLKSGDRIEILTVKEGNPSRDWLNQHLNYIKTPRARAKIQHWFKQQDRDRLIDIGRDLLERELRRLGVEAVNFEQVAKKANYTSSDDLFAALGASDIRLPQVLHHIQQIYQTLEPAQVVEPKVNAPKTEYTKTTTGDVYVAGVGNLLSHMAKCCAPVPGDQIIGYVTLGRGVTVHRQDCVYILKAESEADDRLIEVDWAAMPSRIYPVQVDISAIDRQALLRDITGILTNEKINVTEVKTHSNKADSTAHMRLTVEVSSLEALGRLLSRIQQLPNIIDVKRVVQG